MSGVVTIAALGSDIVSLNRSHGNLTISGTSMATPAVAGEVALILEKYPLEMDFTAFLNVGKMLVDNAMFAASVFTEDNADGNPQDFNHPEGLLNIRLLDEVAKEELLAL